jgi:SAM-dependent methyltransferase
MTTEQQARRDRELFDRIAEDYCQKDLLPAHRHARKLRLLQTFRHTDIDASGDILEIGCGAGFAATYLRGRYRTFHGIDHSTKLVELANAINTGPGITFETADATTFAIDRRFDVIFMIGVLHHLSEPVAALRHLTTLLKPEGSIVVNEPHDGNPLIQLARRVRTKTDSDYSEDQRMYSGDGLRAVFNEAGCELVKLIPQGLLSTPFAEVALPAQALLSPLSSLACAVDRTMENAVPWALKYLTWNLIAVAKCTNPNPL